MISMPGFECAIVGIFAKHSLCCYIMAIAMIWQSLFFTSIWSPDFHWPPPPPVGGGGTSGGGGASGDWEPDPACPVIVMPWDLILASVKDYAGTLYNDELWVGADGATWGRFFLDITYVYYNGDIVYHGNSHTYDIHTDFTSDAIFHRPYTGAEFQENFFTIDDTLPGALPRYGWSPDSLVRDGVHGADFQPWTEYQASYLVGDDDWQASCLQWIVISLLTCFCKYPVPWFTQKISLPEIVLFPIGQGVSPAIFLPGLLIPPSITRREKRRKLR